MPNPVTYSLKDDLGIIQIDSPPVNALAQAVRQGIADAIAAAQKDASKALLLCCGGRTFVAGADITEFGKPPQPPHLPEVLQAIEDSAKPVIAALHGTALGGGFELALACHYRCALGSARVGLPEVHLGILPGAGGTQRVPRLAGAEAAVEIITSGKPLPATKALDLELVDKVFTDKEAATPDALQQAALAYAKGLLKGNAPLRRVRDLSVEPVKADYFAEQRARLAKRARGQIAFDRIIDCIEAAVQKPFEQGLQVEREKFMELLQSPESAAMRHVFFAERLAAKIKDLPKDIPPRAIQQVAVIGGGTMGGGIAMCFANVGIPVTLLEVSAEALQKGLGVIRKNYEISQQKGRISAGQLKQRVGLIRGTTDYADLADADLVVEAVFENLQLKKEVFSKLDATCKPGCILATNTSYQDVDAIAAVTKRPADVLGMHFFSPANVMRLLEVVRGAKTAPDVLATAMAVGKGIRKVCVLARVCYGFIGNRMLSGYGRESQQLLLDGCSPAQVDSAMESFGMAMGPLAMADLAGLDIGYKARQSRLEQARNEPGYDPDQDEANDPAAFRVSTLLVETERLGQKSGAGFYTYDPKTRARQADPAVEDLIKQEASRLGIAPRKFSDEEIIQRCLYPLINEGARLLQEGIAQRASDIDIVYVYGYAFPAAKGGPMFYADQVGLDKVYECISRFYKESGAAHWQPAPLLEELAKAKTTDKPLSSFAAWDKQNSQK